APSSSSLQLQFQQTIQEQKEMQDYTISHEAKMTRIRLVDDTYFSYLRGDTQTLIDVANRSKNIPQLSAILVSKFKNNLSPNEFNDLKNAVINGSSSDVSAVALKYGRHRG
ncbi:MAG: hypothetical protein KAH00_01895, partial [Cocleimonas sp.]|nr:hypothetical protein [Cocleimonas sp.]